MNRPESFYEVFEYHNFMHDAIDYGLTYKNCTIQKNVTTASGYELKKGQTFHTVYFLFDKKVFRFINWKEVNKHMSVPDTRLIGGSYHSIDIPQEELAPFLKW